MFVWAKQKTEARLVNLRDMSNGLEALAGVAQHDPRFFSYKVAVSLKAAGKALWKSEALRRHGKRIKEEFVAETNVLAQMKGVLFPCPGFSNLGVVADYTAHHYSADIRDFVEIGFAGVPAILPQENRFREFCAGLERRRRDSGIATTLVDMLNKPRSQLRACYIERDPDSASWVLIACRQYWTSTIYICEQEDHMFDIDLEQIVGR